MKLKYYIIVITISLGVIIPNSLLAQTTVDWDAPGATWVYQKTSMSSGHYQVLRIDGDTIIDDQSVKKIRITEFHDIGYDTTFILPEQYLTTKYMYESNDSIFIYQNEKFVLLYNFAASVGDSWQIEADTSYFCVDGTPMSYTDEVLVDKKNIEIYSGIPLETLHVSDGQIWTLGDKIIPGIGSLTTPFTQSSPWSCTTSIQDAAVGHYQLLACYYNNEVGYLINNQCMITLTPTDKPYEFSINAPLSFPNPTEGIIFFAEVLHKQKLDVYVYDINGKLCFESKSIGNSVNIRHLTNGVYFLSLYDKKNILVQTFKVIKT